VSAIFIIGKSLETGMPLHVRNAKNGLSCNTVCYECDQKLEAVQGKRDWYFRHYDKSNCIGNNETALHLFAKKILFENTSLLTKKKTINYSEPSLETVIDKYRSDVSAKYNSEVLHFEIVVHNRLSAAKEQYYRSGKINCIQIDLSNSELLSAQPEQIIYEVLQEKRNKKFVQWNEDIVPVESVSNTKSWLIGFGVLIVSLLLFWKPLFGKNKKRKKL